MASRDVNRTVEAVWRIESARLIAALARIVGDVGLAEDLAQEALVAALEQWPESGVPDKPGAWLMATARNRGIDRLRRSEVQARKLRELGRDLEVGGGQEHRDLAAEIDDPFDDDLLRLIFTACHPLLSVEARVALTLRLLGGLTTREIARAYLVAEATVAQRIVRAKRTLAAAEVRFEVPGRDELPGTPRRGPRGHLPDLQRGLRGERRRGVDPPRADRGGAEAGADPGRAAPRRAGGPRPRRADGAAGIALPRQDGALGRGDPARRAGPLALGLGPDRAREGGARPRPGLPARSVPTACRPRSPPATPTRAPPPRPTGSGSPRSTTASPSSPARRWSS